MTFILCPWQASNLYISRLWAERLHQFSYKDKYGFLMNPQTYVKLLVVFYIPTKFIHPHREFLQSKVPLFELS